MAVSKQQVQREQRSLLRRVMQATGKTSTAVARQIGVYPSTLNRFLNNPEYKGTLSAQTVAALEAIEREIKGGNFSFPTRQPRGTVDTSKPAETSAEIVQLRPGVGKPVRFPILGTAIGGEDGVFELNGAIHDWVDGPSSLDGVDGAYGVYMRGESMEPKYSHGQVLFVHPHRPTRHGHYVVVQFTDNRAVVKRFVRMDKDELVVEQLNPPQRLTFPADQVASVHLIVAANELA